MSTTIDQAFIKQFEREVHEAYQRQGSKLRSTVRNVNNVKGASTVFQKVGKGVAGTKSTHGMVPIMNLAHSNVECLMRDYYAGDWVDKLDELKINIDERQVVANAGAYALGRKTDELIITALSATGVSVAANAQGMTLDKALSAFEMLGNADVPDDGERYAIIGWKQWTELMKIEEFVRAEYVGSDALPFQATQAKRWMSFMVVPHSDLPISGGVRSCFFYHRQGVGHAAGSDIQTDITWHGDRAAHFINSMMSQGSALIDETGVVKVECAEA